MTDAATTLAEELRRIADKADYRLDTSDGDSIRCAADMLLELERDRDAWLKAAQSCLLASNATQETK